MNVLILNWRDPKHPLAGGAEISLFEHAKYWQKKGAEITWFASSFKGAQKEEIIDGIKYIRRGSHFTVHLLYFVYFLTYRGKAKDFDKVIDNFHFLPFFTPLFLDKKKIIAFIHEVAGNVWFHNLPFIPAWVGYKVEPLFFRIYKNVPFITVSESTKYELKKKGIKEKNIHVIHNGVNVVPVDKNIKKEKIPTLIYLGRISKDKGIEDALKTFEIAKESIPDLRLWIVGKEEQTGYMTKLLSSKFSNIESDIKYFGFVDEKKKFELLKRAWLLVHPSTKEGWGLTIIEAATQGMPAIAYNVEGLRDSVQNNRTGILINSNPSILADTVIDIINNEEKLKFLSKNAQEYSNQFDWKKSGKGSWKLIISFK